MLNSYLQGLAVGLSLIIAIGAQNAFVLKQGLKKQYVFWVCLICAVSDAVLIAMGVAGFSTVLQHFPHIIQFTRWGGAAFLIYYGWQHAKQAIQSSQILQAQVAEEQNLAQCLLLCLGLTWLNPHVYLDTVILLGSISTQFPQTRHWFALGAMSASCLFFFILGYGARVLRPVFANPISWKILDGLIALTMWGIALSLVLGGGN